MTYVKTLHCAGTFTLLDGLSNSRAELIPVVQRASSQELDQGIQLFNAVLYGGTSQAPLIPSTERATCKRRLGRAVLDILRLVWFKFSRLV